MVDIREEVYRTKFVEFVGNRVGQGLARLESHGWLDERIQGPKVEEILAEINPEPLPNHLHALIGTSPWTGTANEIMGNLGSALAWYQVGSYTWRWEWVYTTPPTERTGAMRSRARKQLLSAVCSDRIGKLDRAEGLYRWAVHNYSLIPKEIEWLVDRENYERLWELRTNSAYAHACLGEWEACWDLVQEAQRWLDADPDAERSETARVQLLLLPILTSLARHKAEPSEEHRLRAQEMLHPQAVATRIHIDHLFALFYLFNLRARHPELASPPDGELPPAERATKASETCVQWMAHGGVHLDSTVESLKVLDEWIPKIWPTLDDEKQRMSLYFWGAYVGEVVREELAGGRWNFNDESALNWRVEWEMGGAELRLFSIQKAYNLAVGEMVQPLYELWEETEKNYLELGLAAKQID